MGVSHHVLRGHGFDLVHSEIPPGRLEGVYLKRLLFLKFEYLVRKDVPRKRYLP